MRRYVYVLAVALMMALAAPAIAQDQDRDGRPDWRGQDNRDSRESQAYRSGYQDGMRDMQRHRESRPNNRRWRSDYDRNAYRSGYQAGYNQLGTNRREPNGNDGYGRYGGGYGQNAATELQRQAGQTGYTDGAYYAQIDMQSRRNNNPTNTKGYKDADHNYNSALGSKGEFQRIYREAFVDGYRRTYR
jgi:hypothetical protein